MTFTSQQTKRLDAAVAAGLNVNAVSCHPHSGAMSVWHRRDCLLVIDRAGEVTYRKAVQ